MNPSLPRHAPTDTPPAMVKVHRASYGAAVAYADDGEDCPEVNGGYHAYRTYGAALLDEDYVLHRWATAAEIEAHGQAALRVTRKVSGPLMAIDSASAGAVIAEYYGDAPLIEAAGQRIIDCTSGIAVLDMHNRLLAWLPPVKAPPPLHTCPHCKCSYAPAHAVGPVR